jgi:hypothetical protein
MTAWISGVILVAAFGLVAVLGLALVVALYRISGRRPAPGAHGGRSRTGPKGS